MSPFLEVRNLVKDYPGVRAVDDVSLEFNAGEIVGLVGKNGAGKSSVIKILAGASTPDSGSVLVDGDPVTIENDNGQRMNPMDSQITTIIEHLPSG